MKQYKDFIPTEFDSHIRSDLDHLLVAPVSQNRDSNLLSQSNWEVVTGQILEASWHEETEIHRFGHWGPGWFELLLIHPEDTKAVEIAKMWELCLAEYPVADDEHYALLESEEYMKAWETYACQEFLSDLERELLLQDPIVDFLDELEESVILQFFESLIPSGDYAEEGCPNISEAIEAVTRDDLRSFLKSLGKQAKS